MKAEWIAVILVLWTALVVALMKHSHKDEPLESVSIEEEVRRCSLACEYAEPGGYALGWIPYYGCYCTDAKQHRWQEH